ncbi:N-(5'-phosphoribosyl)anthranilate isomerase [Roseovarius salis]|uniref:N-(5'-phosphoribosyl)anthranilate isomerase n=1 Tax=Roseovarius salis TaxID=3376063 RepID=UPI0037C83553
MPARTRQTGPDYWLDQMFAAKAVQRRGVVRRSIAWVDREVGRDTFLRAVRARGFHLIETADQYVVVCHPGPVRMLF